MSGLLGGLLGDPAERNRKLLTRELELRRDQWKSRPGYFYRGSADLLLQHGKFYAGRVLPPEFESLRGEYRRCFLNAYEASRTTGLRYCEGVYWTGAGATMSHAWVVDDHDGVLELTLPTTERHINALTMLPSMQPETWAYYGVVVDLLLVQWHLDAGLGLPMLDRPVADRAMNPDAHDWPILKVPYDPKRTTL